MGETSPPPGRPGSNPYLTLRNTLQQLNVLAARARHGQDVFELINPTTDPWDDAEATARSQSAGWGIPFEAFDPILSVARRAMRELVQVAAGNESVPYSALDSDLAQLIERLQALARSVPEGGRAEPAVEPAAATNEASAEPAVRPKRSTERGEARAKLIGALTAHHKYADGGCLNLEPIGNNELARLAGVAKRTASTFFCEHFKGHAKYRAVCADATRLAAALRLLNNGFAPHHLFGTTPPGERERDED